MKELLAYIKENKLKFIGLGGLFLAFIYFLLYMTTNNVSQYIENKSVSDEEYNISLFIGQIELYLTQENKKEIYSITDLIDSKYLKEDNKYQSGIYKFNGNHINILIKHKENCNITKYDCEWDEYSNTGQITYHFFQSKKNSL